MTRRISYGHPWDNTPGWMVLQQSTSTHAEAEKQAVRLTRIGWSVWIVSNVGPPGFVVYREMK